MKKFLELMQQIDLIKSINPQEIELYLTDGSFKTTTYTKNNIVHFVGEVCSKFEIILSGKVVIERIDESGNLMTIAEFFSGEVLGGNLMFSKKTVLPHDCHGQRNHINFGDKQGSSVPFVFG